MNTRYLLLCVCFSFFTATAFCQTNTADSASIKKQDSLPHATFYFYRSFVPAIAKSVKKIPVYINDSLVYDLKSNTCITMKVFKEGTYNVAVDKKGDSDTQVKVKFGKQYFFKCDRQGGFVIYKTSIELVSPATGKEETGILTNE